MFLASSPFIFCGGMTGEDKQGHSETPGPFTLKYKGIFVEALIIFSFIILKTFYV